MDNVYELNQVGEVIKKWSEKPLYQKAVKSNIFDINSHKSAVHPSDLLLWHIEESRKQDKGLENEIDINSIKAALRGYRNEWFHIIKKDPERFAKIFDENFINWKAIMEFKG
jgi:hypothetical protein